MPPTAPCSRVDASAAPFGSAPTPGSGMALRKRARSIQFLALAVSAAAKPRNKRRWHSRGVSGRPPSRAGKCEGIEAAAAAAEVAVLVLFLAETTIGAEGAFLDGDNDAAAATFLDGDNDAAAAAVSRDASVAAGVATASSLDEGCSLAFFDTYPAPHRPLEGRAVSVPATAPLLPSIAIAETAEAAAGACESRGSS